MKEAGKRFSLVLLGLFAPLFLVESFFQMNARFNWVSLNFQTFILAYKKKADPADLKVDDISGLRFVSERLIPDDLEDHFAGIKALGLVNQRVEKKEFRLEALPVPAYREVGTLLPSRVPLYSVEYRFDEFGNRSGARSRKSADQYLLILGDSFVFGDGLDYQYSVPDILDKGLKSINVYNMGKRGGSPADYFTSSEQEGRASPAVSLHIENFQGIKEREGIVIYHFNIPQWSRLYCGISCYRKGQEYLLLKERYELVEGKLHSFGYQFEQKGVRTFLLRLLARSKTLEYFLIDLNPGFEEAKELLVEMFRLLREELASKLNAKEFVIISNDGTARLMPFLEKSGWKTAVFDKRIYEKVAQGKRRIPFDGHPTHSENVITALLISREMGLDFRRQ